VVAGLFGRELADRRQDAKCIAGEHNDVARLAVHGARNMRIQDELDGICAPRVLCDADVIIIGGARPRCCELE
jgi:hypothetical protein